MYNLRNRKLFMSLTLEKNKNTNFDIKNLKMDQDKI